MQFKVAPSQSRLREFRAISHERIHTHIRTDTHVHTSVSNFSFPEESPLIQLARRRGCRATGIRRPRGLIRGEIRRTGRRNGRTDGGKIYSIGSSFITETSRARRNPRSPADHARVIRSLGAAEVKETGSLVSIKRFDR